LMGEKGWREGGGWGFFKNFFFFFFFFFFTVSNTPGYGLINILFA